MKHPNTKWSLLLVLLLVLGGANHFFVPTASGANILVVPVDYPTIESAFGNATDGDVIFVRNGTYDGPMNQTITLKKTVTIIGESTENTIIRLFGAYSETWIFTSCLPSYTDALTIEADDCRIFNLTIIPRGYVSVAGNNLQVVGNNISCNYNLGLSVNGSNCKFTDNLCGGYIRVIGSNSYIAQNTALSINIQGSMNTVRNNICQFISLTNCTNNSVASNEISSNLGYCGINIDNSSENVFVRNTITWYTYGFRLWHASDNLIAANAIKKCFHSVGIGFSSDNRFFLNNFVENDREADYVYDHYTDPPFRREYPTSAVSTNFWDNGAAGNYWENFTGADADGDGLYNEPYVLENVFRVFEGDPSMLVLGQDNHPLTHRVDISEVELALPNWATNLIERPEPPTVQITIEPTSSNSSTQGPQNNQPYSQVFLAILLGAAILIVATAITVFLLCSRKKTST